MGLMKDNDLTDRIWGRVGNKLVFRTTGLSFKTETDSGSPGALGWRKSKRSRFVSLLRLLVLGIPPFVLSHTRPIHLLLSHQERNYKVSQKVKLKRKIINRYLIGSVWPIIKAILKEPFVKGIKGKDFFSLAMLFALTNRVKRITPQSRRQWGTMQPDQMLHHLNSATGSALDILISQMKVICCQEQYLNGYF
jgi:hypothetical protein